MSSIFLSHSSRDNEAAAEVKAWLEGEGHRSIFLDFDPAQGIPAGRNWERELYQQLRACRAVIVLCSEHSMASRWCFAEITHARSLGKHIFPVKVGECAVDSLLSDLQVLDFQTDREAALGRLGRGLRAAGVDAAGTAAGRRTRACWRSTRGTRRSSSAATTRSAPVSTA